MKKTIIAVVLALACSLVQGRDRLARTRENAWEDFDWYKVPQQDREPLWQHCSGIATDTRFAPLRWFSCLHGWDGVQKMTDSDDWFEMVQTTPYGHLNFGCRRKGDSPPFPDVYFVFRNMHVTEREPGAKSLIENEKDRAHLELGFGTTVSDEHGFRSKYDIVKYEWPSRSWRARHQGPDESEDAHIARFYDDEAADLLRKIYRSERVTFTDRRTGESNTALVTSQAPKVIEEIMGICGLSVDETSDSAARPETP